MTAPSSRAAPSTGTRSVIAAIEQGFQGGGTGEVSGAKISQALLLAAADSRAGTPTAAVILFETGGVRLQEANLGLNAVAEICSAVLDLRPLAPVIGIVAGTVGSFGGMSIAAGLCTRLIVTPQARIGLNGPAVIEQEGGVDEFDSSDHALIWAVDGGEQRAATGAGRRPRSRRCRPAARRPGCRRRPRASPSPASTAASASTCSRPAWRRWTPPITRPRQTCADSGVRPTHRSPRPVPRRPRQRRDHPGTRGRSWLDALSGGVTPEPIIPSVLSATTDTARYLAVVPDPDNRFYRAREGQVGLTESLALAQAVRDLIEADRDAEHKRAIIAVVDLPSQAYGRNEEMAGLHQAMAAATDAYHAARTAGHPIVAIVVGTALSGGFLTHGLQADQILALDDPDVEIHAMHKAAAARITLRTVEQLDELAKTIVPMSYDVRDWAKLGFCDGLLAVDDADAPTPDDVRRGQCRGRRRRRTGPARSARPVQPARLRGRRHHPARLARGP